MEPELGPKRLIGRFVRRIGTPHSEEDQPGHHVRKFPVGFHVAVHLAVMVKATEACPARWLMAFGSALASRPAISSTC
jgi:hypothetical protein